MAEHTPGPWHIKEVIERDGQKVVKIMSDGHFIAYTHVYRGYLDNARLIAAAPELVTELAKALDDLWDDRHSHQDRPSFERDYASAFAALAKAGVA